MKSIIKKGVVKLVFYTTLAAVASSVVTALIVREEYRASAVSTMQGADTSDPGLVTAMRDAKWRRTRNEFIEIQPDCQMCMTDNNLQVHHIFPWSLYPDLRYDLENLVTLCQPCHFRFGHDRDWQAYNPDITNLVVKSRNSLTNTVYRSE